MNAKDYAHQLLQILKRAKADGTESIATDALIAYIKETAEGADGPAAAYSVNMEHYKANLQGNLEAYKLAQAHKLEMFRATNTAGQNALRTSFLMNGGASVAILTFIGHLATNTSGKVPIPLLAPSLAIFVFGVLLVAFASGATYLAQLFYAQWSYAGKKWAKTTGFVLNIMAIGFGLVSYGFFAWGACKAYSVFATYA